MRLFSTRWWCAVLTAVGLSTVLFAQDWRSATALDGVDFTGLNPTQRTLALRVLRAMDCSCGCSMKLAECRVLDSKCTYSKGMAQTVVAAIRSGKNEADAIAAAKASKFGSRPTPKILEDPVPIQTLGSPATGPDNARVTLVEFSDFQCPYCAVATAQIAATLKAFPNDVRLIFKQFPLDSHSQAATAAAASLAAHAQGKFWPMHDSLFANRTRLSRPAILELAKNLGLDMRRFTADMNSDAIRKAVRRDMADGGKAGVEGTPTLFINGQLYRGDLAPAVVKQIVEGEIKRVAAQRKK
jgi:protein-disulfide isomerase